MAFGRTVEVSCSRCQRRYAVADHKVVGRRRTSRCRCGNLLIFDGRGLSSAGLEGVTEDVQPLEPTLTPSGAPAETVESSAPLSIPAAPPALEADAGNVSSPARAEPAESPIAEPAADSQTIGRIRLRKTELRPADSASRGEKPRESQRPRAPSTRVEHSPSEPPESPRSLHEAFDSLDLDRLAESIRPTWEAPPSRRVTPLGQDPEVVVHYPAEWQPPPSERRRLRATWEVTPTLPLSFGPPPADSLDDDWETESPLATVPPAPTSVAAPAPKAASVDQVERSEAAEAKEAPGGSDLDRVSPQRPPTAANDAAPESGARVGKSGGPGLDSTAPTAVSQSPAAAPPRSSARLWGAGLAAAALLGLVWRGANTRSSTEPSPIAATPAQVGEASRSSEPTPARSALDASARAVAAPEPPSAPAADPAPEAPSDASPPSTHAELAAPVTDSPSPAPAPQPATPAPAAPSLLAVRPSGEAARGARLPATAPVARPTPAPALAAARASAPAAVAPEPRDAERLATPPEPPSTNLGPDPGAVAQALGVAAARARGCAAPDAPAASGSVRILLDPSGGVLNATALGAFQGTATGGCVEARFRTAATPAYAGRSLSTLYPFSLDAQ